jgi:hypothetical protein
LLREKFPERILLLFKEFALNSASFGSALSASGLTMH